MAWFFLQLSDYFVLMWQAFAATWFFVLPIIFYQPFKTRWITYIGDEYFLAQEYMMLEIIPPRDVEKSPKVMEAVFYGVAGVHSTKDTVEVYYKGEQQPFFSFEIASHEGDVRFYIWFERRWRELLESHFYAVYPDVKLIEAQDYIDKVPIIVPNKEWAAYGYDLGPVEADPIPIKTYHYFEEDVTGKMIDPLSGVLEAMSAIGPGKHLWYQIIINSLHETYGQRVGRPLVEEIAGRKKKKETIGQRLWRDISDVLGNAPYAPLKAVEFAGAPEEKDDQPLEFRLTPGEKDLLKKTEENIGRNFFVTKVRIVVIARQEVFRKMDFSSLQGAMKQYSEHSFNGLKPYEKSKIRAKHLFTKPRREYRSRQLLRRYRERFTTGVTSKLSTAELASLFHMPDMSVVAPGVNFSESRQSGPPTNLPIQRQ